MPDRLSTDARSRLMSRIRSKDTKPEWAVRRLVHGMGYRYVLHDRRLPGTPDLVLPRRRCVIFVHGCFWHGHKCGRGFKPKARADFWADKIAKNRARDARAVRALRGLGWRVMTVWECALSPSGLPALATRLRRFLDGSTLSA